MKNLLFLFFLFFIQCTEIENKISKKTSKDVPKSYNLYEGTWFRNSGMYFNNGLLFTFCEHADRMSGINFSKPQIDTLLKYELIPLSFYKYTQGNEIGTLKKVDYNSLKKINDLPKIYYEIIDMESPEKIKTVGKLYRLRRYCSGCLGGGEVFISDTTQKYGWFIVQTPPHLKPPAYFSKPVLKNLKITSIDPKAEPLCDEYIRGSNNVYRIIKDEEVIKPTKIKD